MRPQTTALRALAVDEAAGEVIGAPPASVRRVPHAEGEGQPHSASKLPLALAALGVVFGDIGTSPLYAIKECFNGPHGVAPTEANVLGVLSLMFWSLTAVVTFKYLTFVMRADNHGEGGIMALFALIPKDMVTRPLTALVLVGAALLFGDGIITPSISVLSAVEGLTLAAPSFNRFVLPVTIAILVGLFSVQRQGTGSVGRWFGPIMMVWFGVLGALGIRQVFVAPEVLYALDPTYAVEFLVHGGWHSFLVLGAVVLCITGGEALYADMGHFGRKPIAWAWLFVAMPALLMNYFGQGALLLESTTPPEIPFFALAPGILLYPLILLATLATVIASQAMISGAFSLTQQAVQLGFFPRATIIHTSAAHGGQIYVPEVNWGLAIGCIWLVVEFRSSASLASAYGIAVTGAMMMTSLVYFAVVTRAWRWSKWKALLLVAFFLVFDVGYFAATSVKIADGGWVPIAIGAIIFTVMSTWQAGRRRLGQEIRNRTSTIDAFLERVEKSDPPRATGTAVFMSSNPRGIPPVLTHHFKHNQVLHDQVILLSIKSEAIPFVDPRSRLTVKELGQGFYFVSASFGFMETPNVPSLWPECKAQGLEIDPATTTFYLGRETLLSSSRPGMSRWRKRLFSFISKNARPPTAYFGLPPDRVVELGVQIEL
jgi:KUP system potassium uptake protein